jgi:hypothetical protein
MMSRESVVRPDPDYDFQLGKSVRLRGWGRSGLAALILILLTVIVMSNVAGPLTWALRQAMAHLFS